MKKRGVSPVIATVLLVILSLAAVGILANYLVNFTKTGLGKAGECVPYRDYFKFDDSFGYDCRSGNLYAVSIKTPNVDDASVADSVKGFSIAFTDENGESSVANVYNGTVGGCGDGKTKMLAKGCEDVLVVPSMGGTKTYVYQAPAGKRFKTADVYAVLGNDRLCDKSDTIEMIDCTNQVS